MFLVGWFFTYLCLKMVKLGLPWWRHQTETFFALLALCAGNSPVTGDIPSQRSVKQSFDVFFDLRLNKRLNKHSRGLWFETPSHPIWHHCNERCRWWPGGRLNIKMPSYQYRDSYVKDKTVSPTVLSLTRESPYLGKTVFILRRGPGSWRRPISRSHAINHIH